MADERQPVPLVNVHLVKNIRNNWITEATQELEFYVNDEKHTAKWSDVKKLYFNESKEVVKMSRLTFEAVCPMPVKRQKVGLCLRVFVKRQSLL